ncbi:putative ABC transport system permease protein [Mesonia phycicola]|uniref:Putative ABC transport system permease protein n=1 Tax=Mesonia phycicola TaxID=579105 RepID=A0A1M6A699_9FLAO|nr:FtsX-like permease family protein [Mesonia phycicola]SHI32044.1 putative ABC transport system permease protein [Mesonia phycicola]
MNIFKISYKNFLSKPLNSCLAIILLALSVALISFSFQFQQQISAKLTKNSTAIDMVVGAKGSPLQLILSSVLHIDNPTGNILLKDVEYLTKNPLISKAIPISYGDNYKGSRIVGTTEEFKTLYEIEKVEKGREASSALEVVLGANVAKKHNLKLNDVLISSHGLMEESVESHDNHSLKVVGIYPASNSVIDNLIVTPLASIWDLHKHEEESHEEDHQDHDHEAPKEITSVLVKFRSPMGFLQLPRSINEKTNMQAALTKYQLEKLFKYTGIGVQVIQLIAIAVLFISVFSIYISLYKIVNERRYELALMRVYGANWFQLVLVVFYEGLIIVLLGYLLGLVLSNFGGAYLYHYIAVNYNYVLEQNILTLIDAYLFVAILLLLVMATLFNIKSIFTINVSKILSNEK